MSNQVVRSLETLICDVCSTILIKSDVIDCEAINEYINGLKNEEIKILNKSSNSNERIVVRTITQKQIYDYIKSFKDSESYLLPFDFDQTSNYEKYLEHFDTSYKNINNGANYPKVFTYVFDCIKEASENYRLFSSFSQSQNDIIIKNIQTQIEGVVAVAAKTAADDAEKKIKEGIKDRINSIETDLNKEVSKTSVTILGIFSGIVLAFVAGLSYSASVLESISSTNYFKLISVASLVGLVCYHLIALMFRFIIRVREPDSTSFKWNRRDVIVTLILLVLIVAVGALQYVPKLNAPLDKQLPLTSAHTNIEINNEKFTLGHEDDNDVDSNKSSDNIAEGKTSE